MHHRIPTVSVLIPAHNEEENIASAIESAIFQKTDFDVEIIVIDDGSTDQTEAVARSYELIHPNLRIIKNETRSGKGFSVRTAYNSARGKYVHVLDADDVFSNWDKLQRQVEILERRSDCFAVAHNALIVFSNNSVRIAPDIKADAVFNYVDCYNYRFYCHTSSCLFRRLEGGLPDYFVLDTMRGDTAFFYYHAFTAKKSVYVMNRVMSIYNDHGAGIWSSLDERQKVDFNIATLQDIQNFVVQNPNLPEHIALKARIDELSVKAEALRSKRNATETIEDLAKHCERTASTIFRREIRERAFRGMYSLPYVDSLMETIGRSILMRSGFTLRTRDYSANKAVIIVSGFVPNGGGVFREIKEIVHALIERGIKVDIISSGKIATPDDIIRAHFEHSLIQYTRIDVSRPFIERIGELIKLISSISPDRIYPFVTHHDVVSVAALQRGLGREIVFDFVYDHGLSLGVHNSAIDVIVAKNQRQASALSPMIHSNRIRVLPPFYSDRFEENPYRPLVNGHLTTASAAARSYKVELEYKYSYFDTMISVMKDLDVKHIHFGPLSEEAKASFQDKLMAAGVHPDRFIHIPWAEDFSASLLDLGVDVFISPFPVCSARIGIEVMSCGIPCVNHRASLPRLPEASDFVDPNQPIWETPSDLLSALAEMDKNRLKDLSTSARGFFCTNNASTLSLNRFIIGDFEDAQIDSYPRFSLSDLSSESFFRGEEVYHDIEQVRAKHSRRKNKFWHRTPLRRKVRATWYRLLDR